MREIKFRAWGKFDHKMYTPGRLNVCKSHLNPQYVPMWWNADGEEVVWMQYTGLRDKNGKEIYEGDILHHDLWGNTTIIWEEGMFRGQGGEYDVTLADHQLKRCRIIGNIYENPELLGGTDGK